MMSNSSVVNENHIIGNGMDVLGKWWVGVYVLM